MTEASNYAQAKRIRYQPPRQGQPESILTPGGLACVVGIQALPGTSQNTLNFKKILIKAVDEAKMLYEAGVRNIMIQNVNDLPLEPVVGKHIVAYITAIGFAIREALPEDLVLGVSVLHDDADAMVSVASAVEADYIRPKTYVGAVVGSDGVHSGIVNDVLKMRRRLQCDVHIYPDIHDRTTTPLGSVSLLDACQQALSFGLADALIITGKNFAESTARIKQVKAALPGTYVFLGGGANFDNLNQVYAVADGAFVASCLKDSGNMTGNLDPDKLAAFMARYRQVVSEKTN